MVVRGWREIWDGKMVMESWSFEGNIWSGRKIRRGFDLRFNEILRSSAKHNIVGKVKRMAPVDDLLIRLPAILCAKRRPAN